MGATQSYYNNTSNTNTTISIRNMASLTDDLFDESDDFLSQLEDSIESAPDQHWRASTVGPSLANSINPAEYCISQTDNMMNPYPLIHPSELSDLWTRREEFNLFLDSAMFQAYTKTQDLEPRPLKPNKQEFETNNNNNNNNIKKRPISQASASIEAEPPRPKVARASNDEEEEEEEEDIAGLPRLRDYQESQWRQNYQALLKYRSKHGHCSVPNTYEEDPALGRWVKRQRYQYKLREAGRQSTLTESRVEKLESIGFVWDSHAVLWEERLNDLKEFAMVYGHCNVPSSYPQNPQLSTWVKCQRRQYKLHVTGEGVSNLTPERMEALEKIGFEWDGRLVRSFKNKR